MPSNGGDEAPQSWSEAICQYEASKRSLQYKPEEFTPTVRIPLPERRRMERELDPILMRYRDPSKEQRAAAADAAAVKAHLDKPKPNSGTLNLFRERPVSTSRIDSATLAATKSKGAGRDWNLLSHLPSSTHSKISFTAEYESLTGFREASKSNAKQKRKEFGRDFDILSNQYRFDNELKEKQDYEKIKEHVNKRFWATHDYDIVKAQYIDGNKEEAFRSQREFINKHHGQEKKAKLPPSVRYSAGNLYNIITSEVVDPVALEEVGSISDRTLTRSKQEEFSAKLNETIELQDSRDTMRKENRIKFNRWSNEFDRGYDPIFYNELLDKGSIRLDDSFVKRTLGDKKLELGKEGRELRPPLVPRPHTTWDRLQGDDKNNITALLDETKCPNNLKDIVESVRGCTVQTNQMLSTLQKSRSEAEFVRTDPRLANPSSGSQPNHSSRLHSAASSSHPALSSENRMQPHFQSNSRQYISQIRSERSKVHGDEHQETRVQDFNNDATHTFRDLTKSTPSRDSNESHRVTASNKTRVIPSLNLTLNSNDANKSARTNTPKTAGGISVRTGGSAILQGLENY